MKSEIESAEDRLKFPPGFKFWWKISRVLKVLDKAGAPSEQVITSSYECLNNWLSKEKKDRVISWENVQT